MAMTYKVRKGDTLDGIAKRFELKSSNPIWIYNSYPVLCDPPRLKGNRDHLATGAEIFIPMTEEKYLKTIGMLNKMVSAHDRDTHDTLEQLREDQEKMDRFSKRLDLAAEVLTGFASAGRVAIQSAGRIGARYATYLVGKELIEPVSAIVSYAIPEGSEEDGTKPIADGVKITVKSVGSGLSEQGIKVMARNGVSGEKFAGDTGVAAVKGAAKAGMTEYFKHLGMRESDADQIASITVALVDKPSKMVMGVAKALQPSVISKYMVQGITGEHPEEAFRSAIAMVKRNSTERRAKLMQQILRLGSERKILYTGLVAI